MEKKKSSWAQLWTTEDWLAVWIGFIVIALGCVSVLTGAFDFSAFNFKTWGWGEAAATNVTPLGEQMSSPAFWTRLLLTFAVLGILFTAGARLLGEKARKYFPAFVGVFVLAVIVRLISAEFTLNRYLEWAFWALIMGFSVLFSNIAKFGLYGLGISWVVCPLCIIFMWWFGTKVLKIKNKPLVITLASATSVCGTSAAIATGAAANCKKTDLTVAVSISIIFTVIMMVAMPPIIEAVGMSPIMGGALIGGTVDSTGAVVVAGTALGEEAQTAAVLVKSIQNILIGFVAFFVSLFFATRVEPSESGSVEKVGAIEIWRRFPKFILGFFAASLIASFIIQPAFGPDKVSAINGVLDQYKNWAFVLAFVSIGLDTNFKEIVSQLHGGKVVWLYIVGQLFNIVLTMAMVWLLLSGVLFPVPTLD